MKELLYKANRWFELYVGWFFTNGNKVKQYAQYLEKKYK
jgi:hypothetical protein